MKLSMSQKIRSKLKYLSWKVTGMNRMIRFIFVIIRRFKANPVIINEAMELEFKNHRVNFTGDSASKKRMLKRDMLKSLYLYGADFNEYFFYDFMGKSNEERETFLTMNNRYKYLAKLNRGIGETIFNNKFMTYQSFAKYYNRDR